MGISEFQYREMLFRTRNPIKGGEWSGGVEYDKESNLHADIIRHCKERGWIYFHGSMATKTHRTKGEPDFTIFADHGRTFAIECKSKTGKLSTDQLALIAQAKSLDHTIHVVSGYAQFLEVVK